VEKKKYNIIYADPPWKYSNVPMDATTTKKYRSPEAHYNTMCIDDIKLLPVQSICEDNCVLFIWVTFPLLQEGLDVIKSWGFEYKTVGFTWVKLNKRKSTYFVGMGSYTRSNAELCLLATKGKPLKRISHSVSQVVDTKIREHSRKPDVIRTNIVELFGDLPRIELFARQEFPGWDVWGNEVNCSIDLYEKEI
jgi:N6-adenosine-specific RNA methylase IME4